MQNFLFNKIKEYTKKYKNAKNVPLKIVLVYFIASILLVIMLNCLFKLKIFGLNTDGAFVADILKGAVYVCLTSILIFALIKFDTDKTQKLNNDLQNTNADLEKAKKTLQEKCKELEDTQLIIKNSEERYKYALECSKDNEERMKYTMFHDLLTGFYNRNYYIHKLKSEISELILEQKGFALLNIDLDNFKKVNDLVGHDLGDQLLIQISELFKKIVSNEDEICRIGGDQFIILLKDIQSAEQIFRFLGPLNNYSKQPFKIGNLNFNVTGSIGITVFPNDGADPVLLFRNADMAMYEAKKLGKNRCCFYNKDIEKNILRRTEIESGLKKGLENGEFILFYQPKYDALNEKITGFEALIRWEHPKYGLISPQEFIPIAEETGFIIQLGLWVIENTCSQVRQWIDKGYTDYTVSVNVSVIQLKQTSFKNDVLNIINQYKLSPEYIELEITESTLIDDVDRNVAILNELREAGIGIALDDFGTGYSSLNYLIKIPISTLKIDKSFIDEICENTHEKIITDIIIKLAHQMNFEVVAEGVEKKEQLELLKNLCCDKIQGYYFSKPLITDEAETLLKEKIAV